MQYKVTKDIKEEEQSASLLDGGITLVSQGYSLVRWSESLMAFSIGNISPSAGSSAMSALGAMTKVGLQPNEK